MMDRPRFDAILKLEPQMAALKAVELFAHLPAADLLPLARRTRLRRVRGSGVIAPQGEAGRELYVVARGTARAVVYGRSGREMTVERYAAGDFFGEQALLDGAPHSVTFVAGEGLVLLAMEGAVFLDLVRRDPRVAAALMAALSRRQRRTQRRLAEVALEDVTTRLVRALASLGRERGEETDDGLLVRNRPTQQELANQVGTCRETISRALSSLSRRGLVRASGRDILLLPPLLAGRRLAA